MAFRQHYVIGKGPGKQAGKQPDSFGCVAVSSEPAAHPVPDFDESRSQQVSPDDPHQLLALGVMDPEKAVTCIDAVPDQIFRIRGRERTRQKIDQPRDRCIIGNGSEGCRIPRFQRLKPHAGALCVKA